MCVCGNRLLERLMSPSSKSQVMFTSAFSWIGDFFVFLAFILFTLWPLCWICEYACNELMQPTVVVGEDWTLHPWCNNSSNVGVSLRATRGNSSNVRGVTAGQVRHNSSPYNNHSDYYYYHVQAMKHYVIDIRLDQYIMHNTHCSRKHNSQFLQIICQTHSEIVFPIATEEWNALPSNIILSNSVESFPKN